MLHPGCNDDRSDDESGGNDDKRDAESVSGPSVGDLSEEDVDEGQFDIWNVANIHKALVDGLTADYRRNFLYRWHCATEKLQSLLRTDVLLPLSPEPQNSDVVYRDVELSLIHI